MFFIETSSGHGSGWLIEPGLIVTNEHVVTGHSEVTVRQPEHEAFEAVVLAVDSLKDIALLQFDTDTIELHPSAEPLKLGQITSNNIAESGLVVGMTRAARERTLGGQRVVGTFFAVHIDEIRATLPMLKRGESR